MYFSIKIKLSHLLFQSFGKLKELDASTKSSNNRSKSETSVTYIWTLKCILFCAEYILLSGQEQANAFAKNVHLKEEINKTAEKFNLSIRNQTRQFFGGG